MLSVYSFYLLDVLAVFERRDLMGSQRYYVEIGAPPLPLPSVARSRTTPN